VRVGGCNPAQGDYAEEKVVFCAIVRSG